MLSIVYACGLLAHIGEYSQMTNLKCVLHVIRTFPGGTKLCWLHQQPVFLALSGMYLVVQARFD